MKSNLIISLIVYSFFCLTFNINAQWVNTDGFGLYNANTLASSGETILLGGDEYIFRSTNNGLSWSKCLDAWSGGAAICFDRGRVFADGGQKISRSLDNGLTWIPVTVNLTDCPRVNDFTFWDNFGIAATSYGILHSSNNGNTWNLLINELHNKSIRSTFVLNNNVFAGTSSNGIYRSSDNGYTWSRIDNNFSNYLIAFDKLETNLIAVNENGVFISFNEGVDWNNVNSNLPSGINISSLAVDGSDIYIGSNLGVYKSLNYGSEWLNISNGLPENNRITTIGICNFNLYAGVENKGIYRSSNNGLAWISDNYGFPSVANICNIHFSEDNVFVGTKRGAFISDTNNIYWSRLDISIDDEIKDLIKVNGIIYAGSWYNGVSRSSDNGVSWIETNNGLTNTNIFSFTTIDTVLFAATYGGGIFKLNSQSETWTPVNSGFTDLEFRSIIAYNNMLIAGSYQHGIFVSTDLGESWTPKNSGLAAGDILRCMIISGDTVYVGLANSGVYYSSLSQISWKHIPTTGFSSELFTSIAVTDDYIFAGTWTGVYCINKRGTHWNQIDYSGLSGYNVTSINALAIWHDKILAGTNGSGIWMRSLSEIYTSVEDIQSDIPETFSLNQNYPNPFNPSTTINYSIPKEGLVKIKVFDILGREVTQLVNSQLNAGTYKAEFNGVGLASGIYVYTLFVDNNLISSKKMLLMK